MEIKSFENPLRIHQKISKNPIYIAVVVVVVAVVGRKISKFSKILGRIWDGLGMILGRFGGIFEPVSDRL